MSETYSLFWGGIYSQWAKSNFMYKGIKFNCTEQFMMFCKAMTFGDVNAGRQIMSLSDPRKQKAVGRKVKNFDVDKWDAICDDVVYVGNFHKFTDNADMLEYLQADKADVIVEASPYDKIWGIGLGEEDPRAKDKSLWQGENRLGYLITELRGYLSFGENPEQHNKRIAIMDEFFAQNEDYIKRVFDGM